MMKPLYLRLDKPLDRALRAELKRRQAQDPTATLADLVREILRLGLSKKNKPPLLCSGAPGCRSMNRKVNADYCRGCKGMGLG